MSDLIKQQADRMAAYQAAKQGKAQSKPSGAETYLHSAPQSKWQAQPSIADRIFKHLIPNRDKFNSGVKRK
jgi:hypothetical protein